MSSKKIDYDVTKADLWGVFIRHFGIMFSVNYERHQALGYLWCIMPVLKKFFPDKEELKKWAQMHMRGYYNVTPQMQAIVMGIDLAMTKGGAEPEVIKSFKTSIMGPFCGIGDSIWRATLEPIIFGMGATMAVQGNIAGIFVALIGWLAVRWGGGWWLITESYKSGAVFLAVIRKDLPRYLKLLSIFSMFMGGAFIANFVNLSTPLVIKELGINLQTILNGLMPKLLPLLGTLMSLTLLRRGYSTTKLVILYLPLGFILGWFGLLA